MLPENNARNTVSKELLATSDSYQEIHGLLIILKALLNHAENLDLPENNELNLTFYLMENHLTKLEDLISKQKFSVNTAFNLVNKI